ncbi:MAG: hypothetical protein IKK33_16475 [Lachnospiraceae bacterium]|nr:hypothetical protein [Lachnospiraceae bacterium]
MIKLKDIYPPDRFIYHIALSLQQPFSIDELHNAILEQQPEWTNRFLPHRCKHYVKQKMLKRTGHFRNKRYFCLLTETDMMDATYIYSPPLDVKNNPFVCGL